MVRDREPPHPRGSWLGATAEATRAAVEAAAWSALELAGSGLEFVVASRPDRAGRPIRDIRPGWTLQVLPYLPGWSTSDGGWEDPAEHPQLAGLLGRLHGAVPPKGLLRWDPAITSRDTLRTALDELVDCDTIQLAPRERDLAMLPDEALELVLPAYQEHAGPVPIAPERIELFHLWWALAELCGCVEEFRRPHTDSLDSRQSGANLIDSLPQTG